MSGYPGSNVPASTVNPMIESPYRMISSSESTVSGRSSSPEHPKERIADSSMQPHTSLAVQYVNHANMSTIGYAYAEHGRLDGVTDVDVDEKQHFVCETMTDLQSARQRMMMNGGPPVPQHGSTRRVRNPLSKPTKVKVDRHDMHPAEVIKIYFPGLIKAISGCLLPISDKCLAKGLIHESIYDIVLEPGPTPSDKTRTLMRAVIKCIEINGRCCKKFLKILNEELPHGIRDKLLPRIEKKLGARASETRKIDVCRTCYHNRRTVKMKHYSAKLSA